ncbi:hypothetical protein Ddye_005586 [Dipteronia dyeriana]|uniref:RNase H type-1 domain-containing protein n=1 Tax=Dipteronia dyeriana TaxID=168575 RepID=A0AAE0CQD8_9ROSI|nr:hypothetical protein Ddye_005586 [Dipteronia dyeriana]
MFQFLKFFVMWWRVWQMRNKVLHGLLVLPDSDVWEWSNNFVHDFHEYSKVGNQCRTMVSVMTHWQVPRVGEFKINTDVSICIRDKISGIGVVIWDSHGHVRVSLYQNINVNFHPQIVEALAILKGISLSSNKGFMLAVLDRS